jgi:hypothetical protein
MSTGMTEQYKIDQKVEWFERRPSEQHRLASSEEQPLRVRQ